jgi:hypothetical protein
MKNDKNVLFGEEHKWSEAEIWLKEIKKVKYYKLKGKVAQVIASSCFASIIHWPTVFIAHISKECIDQ